MTPITSLSFRDTYIVALLRLPKPNVLRSEADDVSLMINDARSGAAGTNIYANLAPVAVSGVLRARLDGQEPT